MTGVVLLGKGPRRCGICGRRRAVIGWCDQCRKSEDKNRRDGDGTVLAIVMWSAKRARRFALAEGRALEKRRTKKARVR